MTSRTWSSCRYLMRSSPCLIKSKSARSCSSTLSLNSYESPRPRNMSLGESEADIEKLSCTPIDEALLQLKSHRHGLTEEDSAARLLEYGKTSFIPHGSHSAYRQDPIFWKSLLQISLLLHHSHLGCRRSARLHSSRRERITDGWTQGNVS